MISLALSIEMVFHFPSKDMYFLELAVQVAPVLRFFPALNNFKLKIS